MNKKQRKTKHIGENNKNTTKSTKDNKKQHKGNQNKTKVWGVQSLRGLEIFGFLAFPSKRRVHTYVLVKRKGLPLRFGEKHKKTKDFKTPEGPDPPNFGFCVPPCGFAGFLCFVGSYMKWIWPPSHMNGTGLICLMAQVSNPGLDPSSGIWFDFLHTWNGSDPLRTWSGSDPLHTWMERVYRF